MISEARQDPDDAANQRLFNKAMDDLHAFHHVKQEVENDELTAAVHRQAREASAASSSARDEVLVFPPSLFVISLKAYALQATRCLMSKLQLSYEFAHLL